MSQEQTTTDQTDPEPQSLFGNILLGCFIALLLLVLLVVTELASRAIGPFGSGVYRFVFIALIFAAVIIAAKLPERPEQPRDGGWLAVETPDPLQRGYRRLHDWFGARHPVRNVFSMIFCVLVFKEATKAISSLVKTDLSEPFFEILVFGLVAMGLGVGALLLLSLLAGLLPDNAGENG